MKTKLNIALSLRGATARTDASQTTSATSHYFGSTQTWCL